MKQTMKRTLCLLLALVMTAGLLPMAALAAEEEYVVLEGLGLTLQGEVETAGMTFSAFAANGMDASNKAASQFEVAERGVYCITVYRAGDLTLPTELRLSTLDVSATYGEDYRLLERGYSVTELDADGTIVDQYITPEGRERAEEEIARYQAEALEEQKRALEAEAPDADEEAVPAAAEAPDAGTALSTLAALYEAQTGKPAVTGEGEPLEDFSDTMLSILGGAATDYFDPSAAAELRFDPGETEKQVWFEILDDAVAEGKEAFTLNLDGANDASFVVTPFMSTIVIADDEPAEHSLVAFDRAEYTAGGSEVKVTVVRSGALYSFVTVGVRSVQDGTARRSLNYANVNTELEFLPNQTTAELTIPVAPDAEIARDFSLELYEPLGCVTGEGDRTHITIPAAAAEPDEPVAMLMDSPTGGYSSGSTIKLGGTTYTLKTGDKDGVFKLMQGTHYAGDFYMPSLFSYSMGGDTANEDAEAKYHAAGARGELGPVGHLDWHSINPFRQGWSIAYWKVYQPERYQSVWTDIKTDSGLNSVTMGWLAWLYRQETNNRIEYSYKSADFRSSKSAARSIQGPFELMTEKVKDKYVYPGAYKALDHLQIRYDAERTGFSRCRPEVWIWGVACLFNQFMVELEQPATMEFKTVDASGKITTTKRAPATVSALGWNPNDPLYLGERVVTHSAPKDFDVICGVLTGYNITGVTKDGKSTKTIFRAARQDEEAFTLDYDLLHELDDAGATFEKNGDRYYMRIKVRPVYQYKDVTVSAVPQTNDAGAVIGRFTNELNGKYHVGDELPMDAAPAEGYGNWVYATYRADGYKNPDDRAPTEFAGPNNFAEKRVLKLVNRQYKLAPIFNDDGNFIAVWLDAQAKERFALAPADVLTEAEIRATGKSAPLKKFQEGWAILRTESPDKMTPVVGRAYTVALMPVKSSYASGESGTVYRPVFTSDWENVKTQGYYFDMIADGDPTRNQLRVTSETVDAASLKPLSLEGKVQYSSVTLRDSAQDLKNVPAIGVSVTTGGNWVAGSPDGSRLMRTVSATDQNGSFALDGVMAKEGDTVSVLLQHSGVWQVRYVTLGAPGKETERSVSVGQYNPTTGAIDISAQQLLCGTVNLSSAKRNGVHTKEVDNLTGAFNIPIRTPYTPYIVGFTFSHTKNPAGDTSGNRVELVEGDSIVFRFEVEANGQRVSAVKLRFYNENNAQQGVYEAKPEGANSRYYTATVPSSSLMPGYKLYLQVASDEKEEVIGSDGKRNLAEKFFPTLNSGLTFFVPDREGVRQNINFNITKDMGLPTYIGDMPALGKYASSADTGKLIWEEEYEYPDEPEKGKWSRIVGVSLEYDKKTAKKVKDNLDKLKRSGGAEDAKAAKGDYGQQGADLKAEADAAKRQELQQQYPNDPQKQQDAFDEWNAKNGVDVFTDKAYKNGIVSVADDKASVGLAVYYRLEYYYNKKTSEWEWTGHQLILRFSGQAGKTIPFTFPTPIGPIPMYFYVGGSLFFCLEIAYTFDSAEPLVAEYFKKSGNLAPTFSNASPWLTLGGSLEFWLGVGFNKFISVRGIIQLDATFKWNPNTRWTPNYGYSLGVKGGWGFDLVLVKFNWKANIAKLERGAFYEKGMPTYSQVKDAKLMSNEITADTLNAAAGALGGGGGFEIAQLDMGRETYSAFGGASLMSIPVPYAEKNILEGTLEYVNPTVVQMDETHFLLFFLRNNAGDSGRDSANASSLNYALGVYNAETEDVVWGSPAELETDGEFDTDPAVLKMSDGSVYVAWSSVNASGSTAAEDVKRDLSTADIHMAHLTKQGGAYLREGDVYQVTNDAEPDFVMNTGAILTEEKGKVVITYQKTDIADIDLSEEVLSGGAAGSSQSFWARKIYDPATGGMVLQPTAAGGDVEEYLIPYAVNAAEYDTAVYRWTDENIQFNDFRVSAYVLDGAGGVRELWAKVDNLTTGRSYAPLRVDHSDSLMSSKLSAVNRKMLDYNESSGEVDEIVGEDLLLTWLSDGTVLHTLSAAELFSALEEEDGTYWDGTEQGNPQTSALNMIRALTAEQAAQENWPALALGGYSAPDEETHGYPTLDALTHADISECLGSVSDFGKESETLTVSDDGEETPEGLSDGLALEEYQIVSGRDGNTYLFWTWPSGLDDYRPDTIGDEIWGSCFTSVLYEDDTGGWMDGRLVQTWSESVRITDGMSLYDGKGRMIDELYTLVGTDSGAVILANTYTLRFDDAGELIYGPHNLTQILCEADGSLELFEPKLLKKTNGELTEDETALYPVPGERYALSITMKNAGLVSTNHYSLTMDEYVDGALTRSELLLGLADNPPLLTAGSTLNVMSLEDYVVPQYNKRLKLVFTIQEYNAAGAPYASNDSSDWSAQRMSAFDFHPEAFGNEIGPSLMSMDELEEIIYYFGSTEAEINESVQELSDLQDDTDYGFEELLDSRLLALLKTAVNLETWQENLMKNAPAGTVPFTAFIPVENIGSMDAGALSARIIHETYMEDSDDPVVYTAGSGSLSALPVGESNYIIAPVYLGKEQFNSRGLANLVVEVTCAGERVDRDALLLDYHAPDNLGLVLDAPDAGDRLTRDGDGNLVLNLEQGETVTLQGSAWPYNDTDSILFYAAGASDDDQPGFAVDLDGTVTAIRNGTGYVCALDLETGMEASLKVNVTDITTDDTGSGSSGSGSSGGGTMTVTVTSDTDSEPLSIKLDGTEAAVQELSDDALSRLIASGGDEQQKKDILFDLRLMSQKVETVTIPANTFHALAQAVENSDSGGSIIVKAPEFTVLLDRTAVATVDGQGGYDDLSIVVKQQSPDALKPGQKDALEGKTAAAAYEVTLYRGKQPVTDLGGGRMRVSVPMTPGTGSDGKDYRIYYLPESGPAEKVPASFVNGKQYFWVGHCSDYAAVYEPVKNNFTDVADGQYYTTPVLWAVSGGITTGTGADTFSPDASCTRAQMVTFLWRATGAPKPAGVDNPFNDVPEDAWYHDAVLWAVQAGVTNGTSADTFSPDQIVTRAQCVTFLWRDAVERARVSGSTAFTDVPADTWYSDAVAWAAEEKITLGTSATEFSPDNPCKRSEIVTFLYRYFHSAD